ncbi:alpha/beta hydrolase [Microbacterium sp. KR10-403]|uniref:alpha/beta fold hydrolase n=1 Tax=Microbacterium sp. KR10-403 TaxID=3158581 RepID=UPI0032E3FB47
MDANLTLTTAAGEVPLSFSDVGTGPAVLLLHGGAGPASVAGFADLLAERSGVRVIAPTHPGFGDTPRPDALADVAGLAELYAALLDALDLADVTVIGNSLGGWIASELALRRSPRVGRIALVDAVGLAVPRHPVADFFALSPAEIAAHSYFDPSVAVIPDPATLPPAAQRIALGNRDALAVYGGTMTDPGLGGRLGRIDVPALVVWGAADRIADPDYGRAYAAAIPGAQFALLERSGHVPQLETPDALYDALAAFVGAGARV